MMTTAYKLSHPNRPTIKNKANIAHLDLIEKDKKFSSWFRAKQRANEHIHNSLTNFNDLLWPVKSS